MLKHAKDAEFALLVDQGVIGDNREIEMQKSGDSDGGNHVVLLDLVHHVHALRDLAEDRMHAVQMGLGRMRDEELAAASILAGMRHGKSTSGVLVGVQMGLTLDLVSRAAGADSRVVGILGERIPTLDHEVGDDPVKAGTIVKLAVGELLEVLHGVGNFLVEQIGYDGAFARCNGRRFGHVFFPESLAAEIYIE
jgi:hypothetical protein